MPEVLTEDAVLRCDHGGTVGLAPRLDWITIVGRRLLVEDDPLGRPIHGCPMLTPTTPRCTRTITVDETPSYAAFVTARAGGDDARRLCLATATGRTNWALVATVSYSVASPGQALVVVGP